jgi:cytochrome P450
MSELAQDLQAIKPGLRETLRLIKKSYNTPLEFCQELQQKHGDVVMQKLGRIRYVHLFGAEAHRLALVNQDQVFSNKKAWDLIIGRIFPNGLMLRDGDDHRYHRRIMQAGFKSKAMQRYLSTMAPLVKEAVSKWPDADNASLLAFPTFKHMTLDLAAAIFLGMELGDEARKVNAAFETAVAASMPKIPLAIPGTLLWRGIRARKYMSELFLGLVPQKRASKGSDMFTLLCQAKDEDGNQYTDQEIVDHMIFLMMAAHDTTTSTLTSMSYALARHPEWQERLYQEMSVITAVNPEFADLDRMVETSWVMKESLRLYPPLSTLPKYSLKPFEYGGYRVPAGAMVITYPIHTHHMSAYWDQPDLFDPLRFSEQRAEHKRNAYSWVPFSGGAHMCIGLHFAEMQIKLVMFEMLRRYRWSVPADYRMPVQQSPISKPRDELPLTLNLRQN